MIKRRNGHCELINALALAGLNRDDLAAAGAFFAFLHRSKRPSGIVLRADIAQLFHMDALCRIPFRTGNGNAALP